MGCRSCRHRCRAVALSSERRIPPKVSRLVASGRPFINKLEVASLRRLFAGTRFDEEVVEFSTALARGPRSPGGLLLVGTRSHEPWHFAAHLSDEARWAGKLELTPTLVRWKVPPGAAPHLAVGLERLEVAGAAETLLVVSPDSPSEQLLDRVEGAKRSGALVLAMDTGDDDLEALAHERLCVPGSEDAPYLDVAEHVVSATAPGALSSPGSIRDRLSRFLFRA